MKLVSRFIAFWRKMVSSYWKVVSRPLVRLHGVEVARGTVFLGLPIISIAADSRISIGRDALLCSISTHTALGVMHPVVLRTLTSSAQIEIGDDTGISGSTICSAANVKIGNRVLIGANVVIADTDFHAINPINRRYNNNYDEIKSVPIVIEDDVFIGTGSIILKGVTIGAGSIVGAGSVVVKSVPPFVIVAGNPAVLIRAI